MSSKVQALWANLQAVTATEKNFTVLRERTEHAAPPKLPYIGTYLYTPTAQLASSVPLTTVTLSTQGTSLADLTFIEDGNPDFIDGLINFSKRKLLTEVIVKLKTYQQQKYVFAIVQTLRSYLLTYPLLSQVALQCSSMFRENE